MSPANNNAAATSTSARAADLLALLNTGRQIAPFSASNPSFDLAEAYRLVAAIRDLRVARGETVVGRKIGFTNRAAWAKLGLEGPIWNYMYATTVADLDGIDNTFALPQWPEPRIEPEIALHLARSPEPGMTPAELLTCIDWVAPAFELVTSIFPRWDFMASDATAAFGVHGTLLLGDKIPVPEDLAAFETLLNTFAVTMSNETGTSVSGHARNVLGGPLESLAFLATEIARFGVTDTLQAGEIITTGTLSDAPNISAGESWTATFPGLPATPLKLTLT